MPAAGEYNMRLRWLAVSRTESPLTGEWPETHEPNGHLWCNVEEIGGRRERDKAGDQTGADAIIRIRNYPTVSALDILHDEWNDYYYQIVSIFDGDDELICEAYRNDELDDFVVEEDSDS